MFFQAGKLVAGLKVNRLFSASVTTPRKRSEKHYRAWGHRFVCCMSLCSCRLVRAGEPKPGHNISHWAQDWYGKKDHVENIWQSGNLIPNQGSGLLIAVRQGTSPWPPWDGRKYTCMHTLTHTHTRTHTHTLLSLPHACGSDLEP